MPVCQIICHRRPSFEVGWLQLWIDAEFRANVLIRKYTKLATKTVSISFTCSLRHIYGEKDFRRIRKRPKETDSERTRITTFHKNIICSLLFSLKYSDKTWIATRYEPEGSFVFDDCSTRKTNSFPRRYFYVTISFYSRVRPTVVIIFA